MQMPLKRTHSGRSNLPFDLDEIMCMHTSEDQARIRSSMQQLDARVPLETVMAGHSSISTVGAGGGTEEQTG